MRCHIEYLHQSLLRLLNEAKPRKKHTVWVPDVTDLRHREVNVPKEAGNTDTHNRLFLIPMLFYGNTQ